MNSTDFLPASNLTSQVAPDPDGTVQYLLIALAGREYGVRLATMQEVLRFQPMAVAPVPNTPLWLEGIFSLRGTIISVVSLRLFLGLPQTDLTDQNTHQPLTDLFGVGAVVPRLLVLHADDLVVGLVVDDIRGVLFVRPEAIKPVTTDEPIGPFLEGAYTEPQNQKTTWLIDTLRLLTAPEILVFEPALL